MRSSDAIELFELANCVILSVLESLYWILTLSALVLRCNLGDREPDVPVMGLPVMGLPTG